MKPMTALAAALLLSGGMEPLVPYRNPNAPAPRSKRSRAKTKTRAKNKVARQARRRAR